jgi:hypothetical protein
MGIEGYARAAKRAGCPRNQIENFLAAGTILQDRQLKASAAARECDKPGGPVDILYGGSRGSGKSHWGIAQVITDDCVRAPGIKCLILRRVGKANQEGFEDLRRRVLPAIEHRYNAGRGLVTLPNGSVVVLGHFNRESDVDAYLGLQYDVILIEESTTLTRQKHLDINSTNRTSHPWFRPRRYHTTNPGGIGHGFLKKKFILPHRAGREKDTRFIPATVADNRFVNPEYRANLEEQSGWKRRAWLYGDWDIGVGQFFTNWHHGTHVVRPFRIPKHWPAWVGFDHGYRHYTAAYLAVRSDEGIVYIVAEHCERLALPEWHAPRIKEMVERAGVEWDRLDGVYAGGDVFAESRGGSVADDYAKEGIDLIRANMNRVEGASELLSRLGQSDVGEDGSPRWIVRPRLFVFEGCTKLIECIPEMVHDPKRVEDVLKVDTDDDGTGGDDPYDGVRYTVIHALTYESGGRHYGRHLVHNHRG